VCTSRSVQEDLGVYGIIPREKLSVSLCVFVHTGMR
jgi:hypothetical protein